MDLTTNLIVDYASSFSADDLTEDAVEAARRLTLDSLGCCLGAYTSPPSKRLRSVYGSIPSGKGREGADPGPGGDDTATATVFGAGTETRVEYAALINATMVRYLDYNDTYISEGRACHPSDHVPALIAVAEAEGSTGEELLEAIVLAYEIQGALLDTGATWDNGYDYVSWGAYSGAAAVGTLMGLSTERLRSAIGIAGACNLTLSVSRKGAVSMWKGIAHPYATHNAIQACQLARAGVTGPEQVLEGPGGFFEVASGRKLTVDRLGGRDGAPYRITQAHVKPFPCGYYMQPMITGVRDLVTEEGIDPARIEAIDIETFHEAAIILGDEEKWSTDLTRESADHSIPYTASLAALYGDLSPDHYAETYRTDTEIHDLMGRVSVTETAAMNEAAVERPDSTPSVVRIRANGETHERRVDYAPGHAENPLPKERLVEKAREMAGPLLSDAQFEALVAFCDDLPAHESVDPLIRTLTV